ncbi:MAG: alpha/beta fold hydrolase [Bacteroidetes bacterium]|nr:MAG: alpha/beta fold hydrolase [Bacteroidota bacterium]
MEKFHLLGHSWGGVYAQVYAQKHPEKIQSLFLCSPGSGTGDAWKKTEKEVMQFNKSVTTRGEWCKMGWNSLMGALGSNKAYQSLFTQVVNNYHEGHQVAMAEQATDFSKITSEPINKTRKNILKYPELEKMQNPGFPILITFGSNDIYGKSKQLTVERYPDATTVIVPSSGHMPWLHNPGFFKEVISGFYDCGDQTTESLQSINQYDLLNKLKEQQNAPGMQYQIIKDSEILFEYADGFASIESGDPVTPQTRFNMFSTTKTFTAVAILQLEEKGLLSLDDKLEKYLPDLSELKGVSIQDLLSHQSGLKNPIPLKWIHLQEEEDSFDYKTWTQQIISENEKPKNNPGEVFRYTNVGYLILGEIIESVSGMAYEDYIRQEIIHKIPDIDYLDFDIPESGYASGYQPRGFMSLLLGFMIDKQKHLNKTNKDYFSFNPFYLNGKSYGGLISNQSSLNAFLQTLMEEESSILGSESKSKMFQDHQTKDGKPTGMGLGWFTGKLNDQRYFCHAGGGGGYYCEIRIYPELKISSVLMMNRSGMKDERLLDKLDETFIP